ncbi:hypothetical protein E4U43_003961 [Claviceps pusilla]|uniref:Uncharacterized protein n=1 Tax=Claviceps pusilla TaxID=123648 RepID=A0A9P7T322_9HYPO|nr:hypothetical protein E4U43_003961 [Claviceps pusilla]
MAGNSPGNPMAFDPGQKREASIDSIHKPTSSQGLKARIRSLLLACIKSFGRKATLDSSACLESETPLVRKRAYGDVQRAIILRLSRDKQEHNQKQKQKQKHEDEKKHKRNHKLSDTAVHWTPLYSPSSFPLSGTSRYSSAYLGGSRPSMSLEKALRENERVEESPEMYWPDRGSSELGNLEAESQRSNLQGKRQNASRSSAEHLDDEDSGQKTFNGSLRKPDALNSSPLDAAFTDECRTSISQERDGQSESPVDGESASRVGQVPRREATCIPMRRRTILRTPGVATRPAPDLIPCTKSTQSALSPSSTSLASVSVSVSVSASVTRRGTRKGSESEGEALSQTPRGSSHTDKTKEAIRKGAAKPSPDSGCTPSGSTSRSSQRRLSNTDSASSFHASTKPLTRPVEQHPRVTKAPSSAAVDLNHATCTETSANLCAATATTRKTPALSSKLTSSTRQLARRSRHRARQSMFPAEPDSGFLPPRNHRTDDREDSGAETRRTVLENGSNKEDHGDRGSQHVEKANKTTARNTANWSRFPPLLRVQGHTTNARGSQREASPLASATSATETVPPRESGASRPPKKSVPAAVLPCSSLRKHHPHSRHVTTTATATAMFETPRRVPHPVKSPTGHFERPNNGPRPHQHENHVKAESNPPRGTSQPATSSPPPPPNLSKELPLEPPRKNTLRSTFFKRPRRTTEQSFPQRQRGASLPPVHAHASLSLSSLSPSSLIATKENTNRAGATPLLHYCSGPNSRHSPSDSSPCHNTAEASQKYRRQHHDQQQEQDKRKHSTLLHRPAFSDMDEAMAFDGARGSEPRYRVLHSYNSPAYKNLPIWG